MNSKVLQAAAKALLQPACFWLLTKYRDEAAISGQESIIKISV